MTALGAEEIRTRVESDFSRIVDVLNQKDRLAVDFREGHHRGPYEAFRAIRG